MVYPAVLAVSLRAWFVEMEPGWPFGNRPAPTKLWALWKTGLLMECEEWYAVTTSSAFLSLLPPLNAGIG
jgi:hypothetical protein